MSRPLGQVTPDPKDLRLLVNQILSQEYKIRDLETFSPPPPATTTPPEPASLIVITATSIVVSSGESKEVLDEKKGGEEAPVVVVTEVITEGGGGGKIRRSKGKPRRRASKSPYFWADPNPHDYVQDVLDRCVILDDLRTVWVKLQESHVIRIAPLAAAPDDSIGRPHDSILASMTLLLNKLMESKESNLPHALSVIQRSVLKDIHIYTHRIDPDMIEKETWEEALAMGLTVHFEPNENVTHVIFNEYDGTPDPSELKGRLSSTVSMVYTGWLTACVAHWRLTSERFFGINVEFDNLPSPLLYQE
jgi:hypothetical protein